MEVIIGLIYPEVDWMQQPTVMYMPTVVLESPVIVNQCTWGIEVVAGCLLPPLQGHSVSRMINRYGLIIRSVHIARYCECNSEGYPGDDTTGVFRAYVEVDIIGEVDDVSLRDNCDRVACSEGGWGRGRGNG